MPAQGLPADAVDRRPEPADLLEFSPEPIAPPAADIRINNLVLWLAALSGPVAWALHLMLMYPGVEVACRFRTPAPLYALSAVLFATALAGGLVSWGYRRYASGRNGATPPRRVRFMATAGLLGAGLFMLVIVVQTLPVFFDDPCQLQGRRRPTLIPFL